MSRSENVILTNMCLIEDGHGNVLVQDRPAERYSWSGIAFPGGHIEKGESLHASVVREIKEETGLDIKNPKLAGVKHWHTKDDERYLVFLYKTNDYSGTIHSTEEGEIKWVKKNDLPNMNLAYDLLNLLKVFEEDDISEFFYPRKENGDWVKEWY